MDTEDERTEASGSAIGAGTPTACVESDATLRELDDYLEQRIQVFRGSERLSEEDFAIRINVRD